MNNFLKRNRFNFAILIIAFLSWGRLLFLKGIWMDDWLWVWHYFGSKGIKEYLYPILGMLRPLDGIFFFLSSKLFDIIPQAATNIYNIEKFLIFLINAILLYRIAKLILHPKSLLPEIIAIVYLVSPLVNNIFMSALARYLYVTFFLLSIIFSIKSINNKTFVKKPSYLMAILFSSIVMLGYENFISFELIRPLIIFYILTEKFKEKSFIAVKRTIFYWLPFLIIGIGIVIYKGGFIIPRFGPFSDHFGHYHLPPLRFIGFMVYAYIYSLYYLFIAHILHFLKVFPSFNYDYITIILPSLAAISTFFFVFKHPKIKEAERGNTYSNTLIKEAGLVAIIGILLILLGIGPYPLFARYFTFGVGSRHALLASIGVAVFLSSSLLWIYYKGLIRRKQFCSLLALIVFLWAFECNDTIRAYRNDWQQQRSFWWQFVWRAPAIRDKTFLIVDMPREEGVYFDGWCGIYEFGGPLNLLYAKSKQKGEVYNNIHYAENLGRALLESEQHYLKNWNKDEVLFPNFLAPLKYYPHNLLLASYHNGYLYLNNDINKENSSQNLVNIDPLVANSKDEQIIYDGTELNYPLRWIMGPEPLKIKKGLRYVIMEKIFGKSVYKDWRYYFQRIKASEHLEDYQGIVALYEEAEQFNWDPELPQPFPISVVKSFYLTGNIQKANYLLWKWALSNDGDLARALNMLNSIKKVNNDLNLHVIVEEEINQIWKGLISPEK